MDLRQINRKAAANAAEALIKLARTPVKVRLKRMGKQSATILQKGRDAEELVAAVQLPITGELHGSALLTMPQGAALIFSDLMHRESPGTSHTFTPKVKAALKEAGNIVCGRYFAVLSDALDIKIIENLPHLSFSMRGAVMEDVAVSLSSKEMLAIEVAIEFQGITVHAQFFVLFSVSGKSAAACKVRELMH
jgi:chemotaxis protein CheY-P-specific phosphatase CheC